MKKLTIVIRGTFGKLILTALMVAMTGASLIVPPKVSAAADPVPKWQLIEPAYPTADTFVAAYSVKDFGVSGDGVTDVTKIFQKLLDSLGRMGGGTLFIPQGRYVLRGTLIVPKGVTLRGEWSKPVKGEAVKGTILMAYAGRGNEEGTPFITMEPSSAVRDLAFWYPEQLPDSITPYPPTIVFGKPNYWGNEFCNAKNITLINSYTGMMYSRVNGGAGPVINGIYGTPLSRGVEIDNLVDVGRIEWIDFSPDYWSGSGLPGAPSKGSAFERWIYDHGTGIVMRRNDWSYTSFVTIEGYNKGFNVAPSIASPGAIPNGHYYSLNFINCQTAIYFEAVNGVGIMFTRIHISGGENGVVVGPGTEGTIQLNTFDIEAAANAIVTDASSKTKVMAAHGTVAKGKVSIEGGTFAVSDTDFNNEVPQIRIGKEAQSIITGNRFKEEVQIDNRSRFISAIDQTALEEMKLPEYPVIGVETRKPKRMALYVATAAPFLAKNDGVKDSTAALQAALDQAAADGGGIVFLPPGKYKVLGNLTIPSGVELKGSVDNSTVPTGVGSIIEVYAGRGHPEGTSFLKMSASSGLRGITFDYPEQMASQLPHIAAYPFLIQVTGSDAYIINVGMRAAYNGIDLFTYRTDNHYLDFVTGHAFHTGVKAGGGATGGKIYNLQFNPIVYAAGSESKFGSWHNSPPPDNNKAVYDFGYNNLDFLVLGDVRNETLYNDFHYGSQRGVVLEKENGTGPSGVSLGLGVDGAKRSMVFEAMGAGGFAFINSQIVSIGSAEDTRYIETSPDFEGEAAFYSSDFWGSPAYGIAVRQGKVRLQLANFQNPGQSGFATLDAGSLLLDLSSVGSTRALLNIGAEPRLSVRSSIVDAFWINRKKTALWQFNLYNDPIVAPVSSLTQDNKAVAATPAAHSPDAAVASADPVGHVDGKSGKGSPHLVWIIAIAAAAVIAIAIAAAKKAKSVH